MEQSEIASPEGVPPAAVPSPGKLDEVRALLAGNPVIGLGDSDDGRWRMRTDERRVLLFRHTHDTMDVDRVFRIHPVTAVLLALLHGKRYREAVDSAAAAFEKPVEEIEDRYERELVHWLGHDVLRVQAPDVEVEPIDPAGFVMPAAGVDLERWWLYRPLSMLLKLTDACQRTCRYCSVDLDRTREPVSTERWMRVVEEAIDAGIVSISYLGGDPLLHRGIYDLIRYATGRGIQPFISTKVLISNGTAAKLVEAGLQKIQISIDSHVDPVADFLLDSRGAGSQLLASIENCIRAGMQVRTNSVITPYNVLLFPDLVKRLQDLGVYRMGTSSCGFSLFANEIDSLLLREDEGQWLEDEVRTLRESGLPASFSYTSQQRRRESFPQRAWCTAGAWNVIVDPNGNVVLCDDLPSQDPFVIGNVLESPLLQVWESEAANRIRKPARQLFEGSACFDCEIFEECSNHPRICFRDSYQAYGRVFGPPPYCPKAPEPPVRLMH